MMKINILNEKVNYKLRQLTSIFHELNYIEIL